MVLYLPTCLLSFLHQAWNLVMWRSEVVFFLPQENEKGGFACKLPAGLLLYTLPFFKEILILRPPAKFRWDSEILKKKVCLEDLRNYISPLLDKHGHIPMGLRLWRYKNGRTRPLRCSLPVATAFQSWFDVLQSHIEKRLPKLVLTVLSSQDRVNGEGCSLFLFPVPT